MSKRSQKAMRAGVRRTWISWLNQKGHNYKAWTSFDLDQIDYRFFVGFRGPGNDVSVEDEPDVEEVGIQESYRTINVKALSMVVRANELWPHLHFLIRTDDDIYLRIWPFIYHLERRPPVMYWWGNFDHGSNVVRDENHTHYNSYLQMPEQKHPMWGDVWPLYARGSLWVMSSDMLRKVGGSWEVELRSFYKQQMGQDHDEDAKQDALREVYEDLETATSSDSLTASFQLKSSYGAEVDEELQRLSDFKSGSASSYLRTAVASNSTGNITDASVFEGAFNLSKLALQLPHPDDPMMGIFVENMVDRGTFVNVDDRDWNLFSLNPSCESRFSMMHERTWVGYQKLAVI